MLKYYKVLNDLYLLGKDKSSLFTEITNAGRYLLKIFQILVCFLASCSGISSFGPSSVARQFWFILTAV